MSLPRQHFPKQPPDTKWFFPRVETTSNKQANSTEDPIIQEWKSRSVQKLTLWLPQYLFFTLLICRCSPPLDVSYSTSVMLMIVRGRGWNTSPTQPRLCSATGALVTWNSCVRLLCPALQFPFRNRSEEQPTVQNTPFQLWLDSHVPHAVCAPLPQSLCLSPCSRLSTSLQSITHRRRQWGQGRGKLVSLVCVSPLCFSSLSSLASFSPVLFSHHLSF